MPTISTMVLAAALVASPEPADAFTWTPMAIPERSATAERFEWTPAAMPERPDPDAPKPPPAPPVVTPPPVIRFGPAVPGPIYYAPQPFAPLAPASPFGGGYYCPPGG